MITKSIKDLKIGDTLIKKDAEEYYVLKNIVTKDSEKLDEFHFDGFVVNKRVMSRFFQVKENNFIVKNS
jgi:hypothetical protein